MITRAESRSTQPARPARRRAWVCRSWSSWSWGRPQRAHREHLLEPPGRGRGLGLAPPRRPGLSCSVLHGGPRTAASMRSSWPRSAACPTAPSRASGSETQASSVTVQARPAHVRQPAVRGPRPGRVVRALDHQGVPATSSSARRNGCPASRRLGNDYVGMRRVGRKTEGRRQEQTRRRGHSVGDSRELAW